MKKKKKNLFLVTGIGIIILILISAVIFITIINKPGEGTKDEDNLSATSLPGQTNAVLYEPKYSFYNFTDPNENAFSIKIPEDWRVSDASGLIRPYIDAGVMIEVDSNEKRGFFYISPYGVYVAPNDILTLAGFPEGSYYDPSGGIAKPMLVKKYSEAGEFLRESVQQEEAEILEVTERNDLINENPGPLITKQSAAEITYLSNAGKIRHKIIVYIYLMESSGTGIWASSLFGYYSPEELFNETEYLVLQCAESFKVNSEWAIKEAEEINKRAGIISSTQDSVSDIISSTFEYRSETMDRINHEWSKTILGIEELYDEETGETWYVDSGSKYYWIDNKNNIYGTETDENPFPLEDMTKLEIKGGV